MPQPKTDPLDSMLKQWDSLTSGLVWQPHPLNRPQVQAYFSDAFEILYGGGAGGGKSDLLLGLSRTMHQRSVLLRRSFPDLERSLITRSLEFFGDTKNYNSSKHIWKVDNRIIEFGHMEQVGTPQIPKDEQQYAGAPYDLIGFDQLEQFPEYPYIFMFSRARSAMGPDGKKRRVQVIATANPVGEHVEWIMRRWRAWLIDETAKPGEIRWYKRDEKGNDVETTADDPDGLSRTYIPAGLKDNPYLGEDYRKQLNYMPEPLRSALLHGHWKAMLTDDAYQLIPRAWVQDAMNRWTEQPPEAEADKPLVIGADIARGGDDNTVFAPRRGYWYDQLHKHPGRSTPDGQSVIGLLTLLLSKGGSVNMDVIGVGASAYDVGKAKMKINPVNFSEGSSARDKSGQFGFVNKRAEYYWSFREELEPPSRVMLPPDPMLEADLTSVHWSPQSNGIKIESKDEIKKRLGRSPDFGDSVVLAQRRSVGYAELAREANEKRAAEEAQAEEVGHDFDEV